MSLSAAYIDNDKVSTEQVDEVINIEVTRKIYIKVSVKNLPLC